MTIGNHMKIIKTGTPLALLLTLALVLVPLTADAKQATSNDTGVSVCNTASHNGQGGGLAVDAADPQNAVHYTDDLKAKGGGNLNAAMHSRALSLCSSSVPDFVGASNY